MNSRVSPRLIRPRIEPVDLAFARPCRWRNHVRSPVPRESITCLTDAYCRLRLRLVRLSVSPEKRGVMYHQEAIGVFARCITGNDVPRATLSLFRLGLVSDCANAGSTGRLGSNFPFESKGGKVRNRRNLALRHGSREGRQSIPAAVILTYTGGLSALGQLLRS